MDVKAIVKKTTTVVTHVMLEVTPEELLSIAASFGSASHTQRKSSLIAREVCNIQLVDDNRGERELYDKLNEAVREVSKAIGGS